MFLIVGGGEGSSNRNASRDESVEAGDKSVEAGDESIEAGEKTPQSCYNLCLTMPLRALVALSLYSSKKTMYSLHSFCIRLVATKGYNIYCQFEVLLA